MPPFADFAAAQRFHRMLLLFMSELSDEGQPVGLHQYLLGQALHWHAPRGGFACRHCVPPGHTYGCQTAGEQPDGGRECAQCGPPYPCRTVLAVATISRFPAPWTPAGLGRILGMLPDDTEDPVLRWGGDGWIDPRVTAERDPRTGKWVVTSMERSQATVRRFADDAAFCDYLLDHLQAFAFPYAHQVDPEWRDAVRAGNVRAHTWWRRESTMPYLRNR